MSTISYAPHVFYGGHSLILINLDHSKATGMTNAVCHSYDVRVTLSTTHVTVFCTTRRCDVLRISLHHVSDIRRRRQDASPNNVPAVEVDFTVPIGPAMNTAGGGSTKSMRCIIQCELGDGPNDVLFHALLALWSAHRSGAPHPSSQRQQQSPGPSSSASIFGSVDFVTGDDYRPVGSLPLSSAFPTSFANNSIHQQPLRNSSQMFGQPQQWVGPNMRSSYFPGHPNDGSVGTPTRFRQQQHSSSAHRLSLDGAMPMAMDDSDVDRLRHQLCSDLEQELLLIQQRRMQRQQLLLNLQRPVGENLSSTGTSSPGSFRDAVMDTNSIAAGFASLCPHCGIFSSDEHTATCPHRVVQCLRCLSLMKMLDFAPHTSICSKQFNGSPQGLSPYSPVPPPPPAQHLQQPNEGSPQQQQRELSEIPDVALPPSIAALTLNGTSSPQQFPAVGILKKTSSTVAGQVTRSAPNPEADRKEEENGKAKCPWCGKLTPPEHERKCAERRVRCVICGDEIYLREKDDHRTLCKPLPGSSRHLKGSPERKGSALARRSVSFAKGGAS